MKRLLILVMTAILVLTFTSYEVKASKTDDEPIVPQFFIMDDEPIAPQFYVSDDKN